jgi:hypothetical protein
MWGFHGARIMRRGCISFWVMADGIPKLGGNAARRLLGEAKNGSEEFIWEVIQA